MFHIQQRFKHRKWTARLDWRLSKTGLDCVWRTPWTNPNGTGPNWTWTWPNMTRADDCQHGLRGCVPNRCGLGYLLVISCFWRINFFPGELTLRIFCVMIRNRLDALHRSGSSTFTFIHCVASPRGLVGTYFCKEWIIGVHFCTLRCFTSWFGTYFCKYMKYAPVFLFVWGEISRYLLATSQLTTVGFFKPGVSFKALKGINPPLKKSLNIPEIYAKMFSRLHWSRL